MCVNEILNEENIGFLKKLAHELKTQDRRGTGKPVVYQIVDRGEKQGAFLTLKSAERHLKENNYNYSKKAHVYVSYAWRNQELEKLLNIIEKFDMEEKENEKIWICE